MTSRKWFKQHLLHCASLRPSVCAVLCLRCIISSWYWYSIRYSKQRWWWWHLMTFMANKDVYNMRVWIPHWHILVFNVRRTLPLGSSSGAPGDQQTLLAYTNSYTGSPLSGASSSRSPALPTKPYLLPSLPISETLHFISCLAFVWL